MAKTTKKSQRARARRARVPQASFDQTVKASKPAPAATAAAAAAPMRKRGEAVNFKEEYRYVLKDLKRLGIIALVMLVVLIALSLLLA